MMSNSNGGAAVEGQKGSSTNQGLKKGPWTASEDTILIDYVKKHGEGNWNSVQKNSGLMRCGKSCRLRWANHLRPNLKKGSFTPEEERIIIDLHSKLGNKWARMASQLPGRTDNEIKNYWNTRMKRRQRAGLPIYPQEVQEEAPPAPKFHFQQQQQGQQKHHNPCSPSLTTVLSSSSRKPTHNPSLSLFDPINFSSDPLQHHLNHAFYPNTNPQFKFLGDTDNNNASLALPLSPISPFARSPTPATLFNQNHAPQPIPTIPPPLHYNNAAEFENNMCFTSLIMGAQVEPIGFIPGLKSELPSDQTRPGSTTPVSYNSGCVSVVEAAIKNAETAAQLGMQGNKNSGLLDALLQEAKTLSWKGKSDGENSWVVVSDKGKRVMDESTEKEQEAAKRFKLSLRNDIEVFGENRFDDLSSSQSSIGTRPSEEAVEENSLDEDLLTLLNNFPSTEPFPEWYRQARNESSGLATGVAAADVRGIEVVHQDASQLRAVPVDADPNLNWALGSCYWKNMPGIC